MNIPNMIAALFLTSVLLASGSTRAEEPAPTAGNAESPGKPGARHHAERARQKMEQLQALHQALKLNSDQESAWNNWLTQWKGDRMNGKKKWQEMAELDKLPPIEQMEKKLAFFRERLTLQEGRISATKVFYGTLSPEQRRIFDTQFKPWPGRKGGPQPGPAEDAE
jgi:hypothetical protein